MTGPGGRAGSAAAEDFFERFFAEVPPLALFRFPVEGGAVSAPALSSAVAFGLGARLFLVCAGVSSFVDTSIGCGTCPAAVDCLADPRDSLNFKPLGALIEMEDDEGVADGTGATGVEDAAAVDIEAGLVGGGGRLACCLGATRASSSSLDVSSSSDVSISASTAFATATEEADAAAAGGAEAGAVDLA